MIDRVARAHRAAVRRRAGRQLGDGRAADRRPLYRVEIDRDAAARYGLNIERRAERDQPPPSAARTIGETVEGLQRFPINVRYPRELRDSLAELRALPIVHRATARRSRSAPSRARRSPTARRCCRSENARLSGWVYVDMRGRDLRSAVAEMRRAWRGNVDTARRDISVVVRAVRVPGARHRAAAVVVPARS